jgi:hypothetical protein
MDDQPDILGHPDRPEMGIFDSFDAMKLQAGLGGIQLQIKHRGFDGLLFLIG